MLEVLEELEGALLGSSRWSGRRAVGWLAGTPTLEFSGQSEKFLLYRCHADNSVFFVLPTQDPNALLGAIASRRGAFRAEDQGLAFHVQTLRFASRFLLATTPEHRH